MRRRHDGQGVPRMAHIGVRLDPVELDCIDWLAHEPTLCGTRRSITRSEVIRILVRDRINQALKGSGLTGDQIATLLAQKR